PQGARTFGLTPMVAIVSALPLAALFRWKQSALARGILRLTAVAVLGYLSFSNLHTFFVEQRYSGGVWGSFAPKETWIGTTLRNDGARSILYVPAELQSGPTQ